MRLKAELWLFVVTLLWAGTFSIIKPALEFISPMIFVFIRFFLAGIVLLLIFRAKLFSITKQSLIGGFWLGIFLFAGFVVQTIGLKYTTATKSALITGTFVVWTPILSTLIERKPPKLGNVLGLSLIH
ncbi:MAG: DMT family transporter, partial [Ignavibacteria bacterium]|nr:DMT family transporter [Ignavibacteria bacterium]